MSPSDGFHRCFGMYQNLGIGCAHAHLWVSKILDQFTDARPNLGASIPTATTSTSTESRMEADPMLIAKRSYAAVVAAVTLSQAVEPQVQRITPPHNTSHRPPSGKPYQRDCLRPWDVQEGGTDKTSQTKDESMTYDKPVSHGDYLAYDETVWTQVTTNCHRHNKPRNMKR